MHQEHTPIIDEGHGANTFGEQGFPADSTTSSDPVPTSPTLDWVGSHAFKARYGVQPGVVRDVGTSWGPRHDQRICHHLEKLDSPTGLSYAYDLTWDEYAVLATDVPATALEAVMGRARGSDRHMSAEGFAGLLGDHLLAQAQTLQSTNTNEWAAGIEL